MAKHKTIVARHEESIRNAAKFHQLLSDSSQPVQKVRGKRIMPIFCFDCMVAALTSLKVSMVFVPEGEGDAAVVALARKRNAYILGNDSDFLILAAGAANMRGYISTEGVQWNKAGNGRRIRQALVPPPGWEAASLSVLVYSTPLLCSKLGIPSSSLPLLASLVGNDYIAFEFFWDTVKLKKGENADTDRSYWRIVHTAEVIRSIPFPQMTNETAAVDYVRDILAAMRPHPPPPELVAKVIAAMLQYAMPNMERCCKADPFCADKDCASRKVKLEPTLETVAYASAQRAGRLKPLTNAYMAPDRLYPWSLPEDPSLPSARSASVSRRVRQMAYSLIFSTLHPLGSVTEYDRNAELRLGTSELKLMSLRPQALAPHGKRLTSYLEPLGAPAAKVIRNLPAHMHPLAAALHICAQLPEAYGRWTHADVYAFARAGLGSLAAFEADHTGNNMPSSTPRLIEKLTNRSVQRIAQFTGVLHDLHLLAQALLLATPGPIRTHLCGWKFVDGAAMHRLLASHEPGGGWTAPDEGEVKSVVDAALTGVQIANPGIGLEPPKPNRRPKIKPLSKPSAAPATTARTVPNPPRVEHPLGPIPTGVSSPARAHPSVAAPFPTPATTATASPKKYRSARQRRIAEHETAPTAASLITSA